ncbi:MAG: multiheme c-type cytochrome [Planctomycetota bacterium]
MRTKSIIAAGVAGALLLSLTLWPAEAAKPGNYVGTQACLKCHTQQHVTWGAAPHAKAFEALAPGARKEAKGKAKLDPAKDYRAADECLACHSVGHGQPGGFVAGDAQAAAKGLTNVGCESCHGPGGEYLAPGLHDEAYKDHHAERQAALASKGFVAKPSHHACQECHDPKHPVHPALIGPGHVSREQVPPGRYVGSKDCKKCHFKEYKSWEATPHAKAFDVLAPGQRAAAKTKAKLDPNKDYRKEANCVVCHVVGDGQPGGYAPGYDAAKDKERLLGVGCEVCHGPGGEYLGKDLHDKTYKDHHAQRQPAMIAKGFVPSPDAHTCTRCHGPKSPTFQRDFDFKTMKEKGVHHTTR